MDLSNLRPADGSKQSDNFRRGRGHGSGNGKTDRKSTRLVKTPEAVAKLRGKSVEEILG